MSILYDCVKSRHTAILNLCKSYNSRMHDLEPVLIHNFVLNIAGNINFAYSSQFLYLSFKKFAILFTNVK